MEIGTIKTKFYVKNGQAKLTIRVPVDKQDEVGLKNFFKKNVEDVFTTLKLKPKIKKNNVERRAQEYERKYFR